MINIENILTKKTIEAVLALYGVEAPQKIVAIQKTRSEFKGDFTLVIFPLVKISRKNPMDTAVQVGDWLKENVDYVVDYNVIKGFLNLVLAKSYWKEFFCTAVADADFGFYERNDEAPIIVEYSSPNTNKPLHLGHIRNNLLGFAVSNLLKANGHNVIMANLINDRGIHICKSMLAWQLYGEGETPESSGMKGDHLIGKYYVRFDMEYKAQVAALVAEGIDEKVAKEEAQLMKDARNMLRKWEDGDADVRTLWKKMNDWVYAGFDITYKRMGVRFDKVYKESNTYLLGKDLVIKGLADGKLVQKEDSSIWADLTNEGLDEKILLRSDGTSVYMTQDLGTANLRYTEYAPQKMVYVVGNEQNYHFDVLARVLKKLGYDWADSVYHLSYGMVELPQGKMKSREGTVVDADDLMDEMQATARKMSEELGKVKSNDDEAEELHRMVSLAALKYFILKVDPKKKMLFNPEESIDFNGNTGPFIQYTYARIRSLSRKAGEMGIEYGYNMDGNMDDLSQQEMDLLRLIHDYPSAVKMAGENLSPAMIANYAYELAKTFNSFYQEIPIFKEEDKQKIAFRLTLSELVAKVIKSAMWILGVDMPERM